jgi:hypothetical protein
VALIVKLFEEDIVLSLYEGGVKRKFSAFKNNIADPVGDEKEAHHTYHHC